MFLSSSTALIPYTKPLTSMEFIRSEAEKCLSTERIERPISSLRVLHSGDLYSKFPILFPKSEFLLSSRRVELIQLMPRIPHEISFCNSISDFGFGQLRVADLSNFAIGFKKSTYMDCPTNICSSSSLSHAASRKKLNGEKIAEALQSEASFTIATDKKPIVATYGCGPCVAVGGYDPTNKIAFVVHFAHAEEVNRCGGMIFENISSLAKERFEKRIQIHLRGGYLGESEATVKAIKNWMNWRKDFPMEITSEDTLNEYCYEGKSLLIDSRTGEVSDYDPKENPQSRRMSEIDELETLLSAFKPRIRLAYSPINKQG